VSRYRPADVLRQPGLVRPVSVDVVPQPGPQPADVVDAASGLARPTSADVT